MAASLGWGVIFVLMWVASLFVWCLSFGAPTGNAPFDVSAHSPPFNSSPPSDALTKALQDASSYPALSPSHFLQCGWRNLPQEGVLSNLFRMVAGGCLR